MMNAPTKSEMIAKMSSSVLKKDRFPFTSLDCSLANCCPVIASYGSPSARSTRRMRSRTCVCDRPGSPRTSIWSHCPTRFITSCAVGGMNAARVAPARPFFSPPNSKTPVIVKRRGSTVRNEILAWSPSLNFPSANVCWSKATSSAARGCRPWRRSSDLLTEVLAGYQPVPRFGAWCWIASPFFPVTSAKPRTLP